MTPIHNRYYFPFRLTATAGGDSDKLVAAVSIFAARRLDYGSMMDGTHVVALASFRSHGENGGPWLQVGGPNANRRNQLQ
jgi:hypothetical protein